MGKSLDLSGIPTTKAPSQPRATPDLDTLEAVQRRVLWLATAIVHHANRVRENRSGVKVGGHQASSASMVSLMTALWFSELRAEDRVSVKPHASPVLHAINYVLGPLEQPYLESLRAFGGLQSYPSRTKDPDPVDFSTGSVGIGATAPIWARDRAPLPRAPPLRGAAARPRDRAAGRRRAGRGRRVGGDRRPVGGAARRGAVGRRPQPAVARPGGARHRLRPARGDVRGRRLAGVTVKYGRRLDALFERAGGEDLRRRIDEMPNEEYQRLLRADPAELRERLPGRNAGSAGSWPSSATTSCAPASATSAATTSAS